MPFNIGDKLNNGAFIVAIKGDVVLAARKAFPHPWVVWKVEPDGEAYAGRYHDDIVIAAKDFEDRAGVMG